MANDVQGPAPGGAAALASVVVAVAASALGGGGVATALTVVPGTWSDSAQMVALTAPAAVSALLGAVAALGGVIAAWKSGLARWPGWIGLIGAALGAMDVAGALGWFAFLGGLTLLASLAWH